MNKSIRAALLFTGLTIFFAESCKKTATPPVIPVVTTSALTNVTSSSATCGGTITSDGGSAITTSGIVWSKTNTTPTITDSIISSTTTSGSYTVNLTGLDFNTTYYIRAFAKNSVGTGYGDVVTLNTTNDTTKVKFTYNGQQVVYGVITSPTTGKKWMDRNLGASRVATAYNDDQAYGDLFQWGRGFDGHQLRTSDTTGVQSSSDVPGHNKFIKTFLYDPSDWRNPGNPGLWQGSAGINQPCPSGWHVPTQAEWAAETAITNYNTGFASFKLTAGGYRPLDASLSGVGTTGYYWTSTPGSSAGYSRGVSLTSSTYSTASNSDRGNGRAIRCIKD
jgi:uncharacterized protein (TIGR02145 family)